MTILVTGATGSVGRLVIDHLLAAGATNVRALTANPRKAALPAAVEVVQGFIGRPETLSMACSTAWSVCTWHPTRRRSGR